MKRPSSLLAVSLILVAWSQLRTQAAQNTWNNGSGNFLWDHVSLNWASPTIWSDGDDAIFGATGVGTVTLGDSITVENQTFNAAGYTIEGGGYPLTVAGTTPTITVNGDSTNAASIYGTDGLTIQGTGVLALSGDSAILDANHYTGGTYIHGGTVICQAANGTGSSSSSPYAIDSIEALDTGATLVLPGFWNGSTYTTTVYNQLATYGQLSPNASHLHMTGGTLDLNNDPGTQHIGVPDGDGLIINRGSWSQARVEIVPDGQDHSWYGVIADGNNGVLNGDNTAAVNGGQGPGYQIGAIWCIGGSPVTLAGYPTGPYQYWYWYGSNTCSASLRLDNGVYLKLMGPNANISNPTTNALTGPMRLYNGLLDLNGHNQTISLMTGGSSQGTILNSAVGTVSTLTIGYGNEQVFTRSCPYNLIDNLGTGGILALKKIITAPFPFPNVNPTTLATNCYQTLTGICTYSGDTTVEGGSLILSATQSVSPNSAYRLSTSNYALLKLNYSDTAPVRQLWIDGVQQPNGVYGAGTPGIDPDSTGTITVTRSSLPNTWNNGSGNFLWDFTSLNWASPTVWSDGADAIFGATGVGTVTLGNPITVENQTFNAAGYTIKGGGYPLTVAGTTPTITVNGASTNAASIYGTDGLTIQGTGVLALSGDSDILDANHYTGGTYIHGGTVICQAANGTGSSSSSAYAIDSIEALDAGATLVLPGFWNGTTYNTTTYNQLATYGQLSPNQSHLHMTGGTLDLDNDPGTQHIGSPDGNGLIINSGSWSQSRVLIMPDGQDHSWYGVIADGNNGVLNGDNTAAVNGGQGPGYQIGAIWCIGGGVSLAGVPNGPFQHWYWYGSNTCSASLRLDYGVYLKLMGPNANISNPTTNALTGPMRLYNGLLDLNGHNQTVALMTGGSSSAIILNSAVGTVSTLTVGYGNEQVFNRNCPYYLMDNQGTGGILALRKIITAPFPFPTVNPTTMATNCYQTLSGVCTYSGDTTVEGGSLILSATQSVSPNSAYRLSTSNYALLKLNYSDTAPVRQLWINGVQQPNGVYGAGTPGIDPDSTGTITVTGYAPVSLGVSQTGNSLTFSWQGLYKLQTTTNIIGPWLDYPAGGTSPVIVPVDHTKGSVFFRLSTY